MLINSKQTNLNTDEENDYHKNTETKKANIWEEKTSLQIVETKQIFARIK